MGNQMYALWGDENIEYEMNRTLLDFIRNRVGISEDRIIWSGYCNPPDLVVSQELKGILLKCVSEGNISFNPGDRMKHSVGKGGMDYIRLMENHSIRIADAVIYPTEEEIICLLRKNDDSIELIPFGGGTTVTGGVCSTGSRKYSISIDLSKLDFLRVDSANNILETGPGVRGGQLDEELKKYGLTLGNFPESFYYSTVGGWIATNAAGQESNRYGKIKDMVVALRMEAPTGTYQDRIVPGESAFFKLTDIATGSEGTFGVITRAWLRVQKRPERLYYGTYMFESFADGIEALKRKFSTGELPIISRLSDEDETELSLMGTDDSFLNNLFKKYVNFRMANKRGAILISISDRKEEVGFSGKVNLGSLPAKFWERERYSRPFMYNELLKRGIVAETIETSASWDKLKDIHSSTRKIFDEITGEIGIGGMILCHSSHQYVTGSALYFTFLFHANDNRGPVLEKIRDGIMENILSKGGSISHHHGVGTIQSKYLKEYKGNLLDLTREIKSHFDPKGSLTPGVLGEK
ncbi:MAG: FAD-binding oxidoreductase [Thermoplasmatales archaeon]|jgi:alkyldihydroxyacetonephosphate synthase|nr:FAD-binding oxidoreductase [Candidatus Thermoplasmatota archaeon]MDA8056209.1 FAD-binding oxidoreductase [Thermoplasmatales archaeon]